MNTKVIAFCVTVICLLVGVASKKKSTTSISTKIISNTGDQVVENISTSNDEEDEADSELRDTPQKRNIEYNLNSYPGGLDLQEYLASLNYANDDHPLKYLLIHDQGKAIPYTSDYTFGNYLKADEQNQKLINSIDRTTNTYDTINNNDYLDYGSLDTSEDSMSDDETDPKVDQFLKRLKEVKILEVSTPVPEPESEYDDYEDSTEDTKLQLIAYIPSKAKFEETDDKLKRNKHTLKNMKKIILPIGTDKSAINGDNGKNTKLHIVAYVPTKKTKTNNIDEAKTYNTHKNPTFENLAANFNLNDKQKQRVQFFINVPNEAAKEASIEQSNTPHDTKSENSPTKNVLNDASKLRIVAYVPKKHKSNQNTNPTSSILSTVLPTHLYAVKQETSEEIFNPLHKGINSLGQNIKIVTFVPKKALFRQPSYNVDKKKKQTYSVHQETVDDVTTPGNVLSKLISGGFIKYQPLSNSGQQQFDTNLNNKGPVPFKNDYLDYQIDLGNGKAPKGIKLHILQPNFIFKNNTKSYSVQESEEGEKDTNKVFLNKPNSHQIISTQTPKLLNSSPIHFDSDENSLNPNSSWQEQSIAYLSNSIVTEPAQQDSVQNLQNKGPVPFANGDNSNNANQNYQIPTTTYPPAKFIYEPAIYQVPKNTDGNLQNTGPVPFVDGDNKNNPTNTKTDNTDKIKNDNKNHQTITTDPVDLHVFLQKLREENVARIQEYMKIKNEFYDSIRNNFQLKDTNFDSASQDSVADSSSLQSETVEHRVLPDFGELRKFKMQPLNTKIYYKNVHHQPSIMTSLSRNKSETSLDQLLYNSGSSYQAQALTQNNANSFQNTRAHKNGYQSTSYQNVVDVPKVPNQYQENVHDFGRYKNILEEENEMIRFLTGGRIPPLNPINLKFSQKDILQNPPEPIGENSLESEGSDESVSKNNDSGNEKQQEQSELRDFLEKLREENARKVNEYIKKKQLNQLSTPFTPHKTPQIITTQRTFDESENPLIYNENGILYQDKFKNQITPETTSYHYLNNGKIPFFNHYAFGDLRKLKNTTIKTSVLENQRGDGNKNFESVAGMMKILAKEIAQLLQKQKVEKDEDVKETNNIKAENLPNVTEKPQLVQEIKLHEFLKKLREENEIKVKKFVKQQLTSAKEKDKVELESLESSSKDIDDDDDEDSSLRKSPFRYLNYRQFEEMEKLRKQHESMFQDFFKKLRKDNEAKIDEFINGYMSYRSKLNKNETTEVSKQNQTDVVNDDANRTNTTNKNETMSMDEIKQKVVFLVIPNFQLFQPNNNTLQNASINENQNHTYFGNYSQISSNGHNAVKYTDISPFVENNSSDHQQNQHVTKFSFDYPKRNTSYLAAENQTNKDNDVNLSVDSHSIYSDSFGDEERTTAKPFNSDENPDDVIEEDYQDSPNVIDADREREAENEKKKKLVCVKNCAIINGGYYTYNAKGGINQVPQPNLPLTQNIPTIHLPPPSIPNLPNIPNIPNLPQNIPLPPSLPRLPNYPNLPIGQHPINPHLINGFYPIIPRYPPPNQIKHNYPPFPYTVNRPYPNNHNMFDHKTWHHVNEDPDTDESFIHKLLYKYLK